MTEEKKTGHYCRVSLICNKDLHEVFVRSLCSNVSCYKQREKVHLRKYFLCVLGTLLMNGVLHSMLWMLGYTCEIWFGIHLLWWSSLGKLPKYSLNPRQDFHWRGNWWWYPLHLMISCTLQNHKRLIFLFARLWDIKVTVLSNCISVHRRKAAG